MCKTGGPRCEGSLSREAANGLIPRRGALSKYYAAADARHCPAARSLAAGTGSQFTDPAMKRVNDVVALAWRQRERSLDGDDRDQLIALGADPDAFMAPESGVRYLLVETPGTVGVIRSEGMPDDTIVHVVPTKPGVPCALAVEVDDAPLTEFGTVVIGPHPDDTTREVVWTAHPGLPIPPARGEDPFADHAGGTVTLGMVRRTLGRNEMWLQTQPRR